MAPLPVIPSTYRVVLRWHDTVLGTDAVNVMHFRKASSDAPTVYNDINTHVAADMWGQAADSTSVNEVDITPLDGSGITQTFLTGAPAKWKGTDTGGAPTPQVTALVKLNTAKRGRSYRGRVYLPYMTEGRNLNGHWYEPARANAQTAWTAFVAAMAAANTHLVVASYHLSSADDVLTALCETWTATQRRRLQRTSS